MRTDLSGASPTTVIPLPRRNSRSPSSRSWRRARRTVLEFTPSTAARSLAGGRRSPGPASPSAMARRISAATCSWSGVSSSKSTWTVFMVISKLAPLLSRRRGRRAATKRLDDARSHLRGGVRECRQISNVQDVPGLLAHRCLPQDLGRRTVGTDRDDGSPVGVAVPVEGVHVDRAVGANSDPIR